MTWDKPRSRRQWLLLFLPASICVFSTIAGGIFQPQEGTWIGWAIAGLLIATIVTFCQSFWLARVNPAFIDKIGSGLVCFIILMMINIGVSFAGCVTGFAVLPNFNMH